MQRGHVTVTPSPSMLDKEWRAAPVQQEKMDQQPDNVTNMHRIGPAQPSYGVNPGLASPAGKAAEAPAGPEPVAGDFAEMRQMDTAGIDQVIDPLRISLKDGRIVQLSGIDIPGLNADNPDETGDIAFAAFAFLKGRLANKQARLYQTKNTKEGRTNRMGYQLAHLALSGDKGEWVQGTLLAAGLARIRPSERNPEMAMQMLALEEKARREKKGLWADPRYAVMTPDTAAQGLNGWGVVEGTVHATAMNNNTIYLNFGPDWKSDFTVGIDPGVRKKLAAAGIDPLSLGGRNMRVHGWIRDYNGPFIDLLSPVWMEMLTDNAPDNTKDSERTESQ